MDVDKSSKQADRQACRQAGPRQTGRKEGRQVVGLVSNTAVAAGSNSSNTAVAAGSNSSNTAVAANFRFIMIGGCYFTVGSKAHIKRAFVLLSNLPTQNKTNILSYLT